MSPPWRTGAVRRVAAHVQLARYRRMLGRILREEAHPIGCCVVKPTGAWYTFRRGSGQRKIYAAKQRLPRGPRGVVEGRLDSGVWHDSRWLWCTPVVPVAGVSVFFRVLKSTTVL